jgi:DNA-binding transcriptional LysR family regulator
MGEQVVRRPKLNELRLLRAVVDFGAMAKAASHLNITQPAVSKGIAALEKTVGVPLVDRTPHGIVPTMYGEVLLNGAAAVFDDLKQSINQIDFLNNPMVGELRFGTIEHLTASFIPTTINRLAKSYPRFNFHVEEISVSALQYRALRERNVEFVISRLPDVKAEPDMRIEVLFDDQVFVAAGVNSPWAKRRHIKLAYLIDEPWSHPPYAGIVGPIIIDAFRTQGLEPPQGVSCFNMQMHRSLLATGRYLAILPSSLVRFGPDRWTIKRLPIVLSKRPLPVGVISLKDRTMSPIARLFIECARDVAQQASRSAG